MIPNLLAITACGAMFACGAGTVRAADTDPQPAATNGEADVATTDETPAPSATDASAAESNPPAEPAAEATPLGDDAPIAAEETPVVEPEFIPPEIPFPLDEEEWLKDPFSVLELEMQTAVVDLGEGKTRLPAEFTQPRIIDRLDIMIEMLERQMGGGGGGQNPSRPANASTLRSGQDRRGAMRADQRDNRRWADLTAKEREKILQSKTDGFPAGYDDILADYFRKLSRTEATPEAPAANE